VLRWPNFPQRNRRDRGSGGDRHRGGINCAAPVDSSPGSRAAGQPEMPVETSLKAGPWEASIGGRNGAVCLYYPGRRRGTDRLRSLSPVEHHQQAVDAQTCRRSGAGIAVIQGATGSPHRAPSASGLAAGLSQRLRGHRATLHHRIDQLGRTSPRSAPERDEIPQARRRAGRTVLADERRTHSTGKVRSEGGLHVRFSTSRRTSPERFWPRFPPGAHRQFEPAPETATQLGFRCAAGHPARPPVAEIAVVHVTLGHPRPM